jgi:hypothetical protein
MLVACGGASMDDATSDNSQTRKAAARIADDAAVTVEVADAGSDGTLEGETFEEGATETGVTETGTAEEGSAEAGTDTSSESDLSEYYDEVQEAYIAYYGRPADPDGLEFWAGQLKEADGDIDSIIDSFGQSEEFTDRFGDLSTEELVNQIYNRLYNRDADADGLVYYTELLAKGAVNLQKITIVILKGSINDDAIQIKNKVSAAKGYTSVLKNNKKVKYNLDYAMDYMKEIDEKQESVVNAAGKMATYFGLNSDDEVDDEGEGAEDDSTSDSSIEGDEDAEDSDDDAYVYVKPGNGKAYGHYINGKAYGIHPSSNGKGNSKWGGDKDCENDDAEEDAEDEGDGDTEDASGDDAPDSDTTGDTTDDTTADDGAVDDSTTTDSSTDDIAVADETTIETRKTAVVTSTLSRNKVTKTVIDSYTGLMWQDDESVTGLTKSWDEAKEHCKNLEMAGYGDWRLPTVMELVTLVDYTGETAIANVFENIGGAYWSGVTDTKDLNNAWVITYDLVPAVSSVLDSEYLNTRCVRDAN